MSQPEIWVSISIRGGHDGADQPPAKVLDLKITAAPTGDVGATATTMLAAPRHPQAAQARPISSNVWQAEPGQDVTGQIPVVNIVLGDTDETATPPDSVGGTGHASTIPGSAGGNGGCVGSFTGRRGNGATKSASSALARGAVTSTHSTPFGRTGAKAETGGKAVSSGSARGGADGSGGTGATTDTDSADDSKGGYGGQRGRGWTGTDGKGGQGGTVFANGYKSIAVAGFGGTGQNGNGVASSEGGAYAEAPDRFDYFDADGVANTSQQGQAERTSEEARDDEIPVDDGMSGAWGRGGVSANGNTASDG